MAGGPSAAIPGVSIVDVVSRYILTLSKVGRNHIGECPFHDDKVKSLVLNDEHGIFHCFACERGGNVIEFLTRWYEREKREK